jgi:hypothetical protein
MKHLKILKSHAELDLKDFAMQGHRYIFSSGSFKTVSKYSSIVECRDSQPDSVLISVALVSPKGQYFK